MSVVLSQVIEFWHSQTVAIADGSLRKEFFSNLLKEEKETPIMNMKDRILRRAQLFLFLLGILLAGCSKKPVALNEAQKKQALEQIMTGATLVGHSARTGQDGISGEERYAIDKVSRLSGDTWIFQARLKFGSNDLPVPIPLQIQWAGDTPVITLTDVTIPGLGTYSARVLLYRDQYAGTWSSGTAGGQLFGKIIRERQP